MSDQLVVHVGTRIEATFGRLDGEGNVVDPRAFRFTLLKLDEAAFAELRQAIFTARVQMEAEGALPLAEGEEPALAEGELAPL